MNAHEKNQLHKHFDYHKKTVLIVLLIFTAIGGIMFAVINYRDGKIVLASLELVAASVAFILLFYLKQNNDIKRVRRIALYFVLMFCIIMLFAFSDSEISVTVYIFALLIPLLAHLLLGTHIGLVVTAIFLSLAYIIFFYYYHSYEVFSNSGAIANIITVPLLVWGLAYSYEQANESAKQTLINLASRDFLTGLYNRSMLNDMFNFKLKRSTKNNQALSILVADLDNFKKINDLYGHNTGDEFIKSFATILQQHSGENSSCFRIGGEEFCVILSNTDLSGSCEIAENIRQTTENMGLKTDQINIPVTVSIGVATCNNRTCKMTDLLKLADQKLYEAKQQGRNRVAS